MTWVLIYVFGLIVATFIFEWLMKQRYGGLADEDVPAYRVWQGCFAVFWPITIPLYSLMAMPDLVEGFESWLRRQKWQKKIGKGK